VVCAGSCREPESRSWVPVSAVAVSEVVGYAVVAAAAAGRYSIVGTVIRIAAPVASVATVAVCIEKCYPPVTI
jgi:hypothetical protein